MLRCRPKNKGGICKPQAKAKSDFITNEAMGELNAFTEMLSPHPKAKVLIGGYVHDIRQWPTHPSSVEFLL
jgi:hypothetical protein